MLALALLLALAPLGAGACLLLRDSPLAPRLVTALCLLAFGASVALAVTVESTGRSTRRRAGCRSMRSRRSY